MNRRRFIQSLAAVFTLPTNASLSLRPAAAAITTATAVPAHARSWAIYMSTLHGECTPQTLQNLLNIPPLDAKKYVTQLVAEGAIKPIPHLRKTVSEIVKTDEDSLLDKFKNRLEMKAEKDGSEDGDTVEQHERKNRMSSKLSMQLNAEISWWKIVLKTICQRPLKMNTPRWKFKHLSKLKFGFERPFAEYPSYARLASLSFSPSHLPPFCPKYIS